MKIAVVSEDGVTISQHFGRAPLYVVLSIEDGKISARETRDKMSHNQFGGAPHEEAHGADPRGHGFGQAEQDRHFRMVDAIRDCQVLLAGGMGSGAYYSLEQAKIQPVITDAVNIDEAVQTYLAGNLKNHVEKLH